MYSDCRTNFADRDSYKTFQKVRALSKFQMVLFNNKITWYLNAALVPNRGGLRVLSVKKKFEGNSLR